MVHEGAHARAATERDHEVVGRDDPRHWNEELVAYRLEEAAMRQLNPAAYDSIINSTVSAMREISSFGSTPNDGYQLVVPQDLRINFSELFEVELLEFEKKVVQGAVIITAADKLLTEQFSDTFDVKDIDKEIAGFIRYLYATKYRKPEGVE